MIRNGMLMAVLIILSPLSLSEDKIKIYAAGSLKIALNHVVTNYEEKDKIKVDKRFGPSGLLRKAIEGGERPDIFASANMEHPNKLEFANWGGPVVLFARNQLCALSQHDVDVTSESLLNKLIENNIRVGTSTPKSDPSGDYA